MNRIPVGRATLVGRNLERDGVSVRIGPTAARLLAIFALQPGRTIPRHRLLDGWPLPEHVSDLSDDTRVVDVHIRSIRRALDSIGADADIVSVRSVGYRLDDHREVTPRILDLGDATLDLDHLILRCGDQERTLSAVDARIVKVLATERLGVRHEDLWRRARGEAVLVGRCLDVHIAGIRKCLREIGSAAIIECRRGYGHRLVRAGEYEATQARIDASWMTRPHDGEDVAQLEIDFAA